MKRIKITILLCIAASMNYAQNEDDVLRYTQTYFGGSARNISMAGTMAGLGGDFSAVQSNPAALARVKMNTVSFTPILEATSMASDFYGSNSRTSAVVAKIGSASYIRAYSLDPKRFNNWVNVQLGVGYERVGSFTFNNEYIGTADSSILHSFANEAAGTPNGDIYIAHPFRSALAWDVFALDPDTSITSYVPTFANGAVQHRRITEQKGGMGEFNFTLSGNYANKIYVGGAFKATRAKFEEVFFHDETYDTSGYLNSSRYQGDLIIKGWGYGARLGVMYTPQENIRLGLSLQTPTFFKFQDIWSNTMSANTDDPPPFNEKAVAPENVPNGKFDYRIRTPLRLNVNGGYIYKDKGAISAELEFVDYGNGRLSNISFSEAPADYNAANDQVDNIYSPVLNFKLGVEARLTQGTYFRTGFALYPSPYKPDKGNERFSTQFYTTGFGFNIGEFFVDLGYSLRATRNVQYSYDPTIHGSKVTYRYLDSRVALTLGLRLE
ncbi:MAG: hypothetical protein MK078_13030 [Crocinitomicaceae bacterium]|nr:hypothetical protein [Crocinitomicaceae bacterium]